MSTPTVNEMANNTLSELFPTLTLHDRCDRCGAAAQSRILISGSELMFCGHHTAAYREKLLARGGMIIDAHVEIPAATPSTEE